MITKEIVQRLPEYKDVAVELPNFTKIDIPINSLDYVSETDFLQQIIGIDPKTGFPRCDIDVLNDISSSNETKEFLVRCMRQYSPLSHPELDDDSLFDLIKNKFENSSDYVERLNEKYILPFEETPVE